MLQLEGCCTSIVSIIIFALFFMLVVPACPMTAAWARLGGRSSPRTTVICALFLEQTTSFHRPIVTFDRRTYASAAAWPIFDNEPPRSNDEQQPHIIFSSSLDLKLRRLATLNGGITINPRSPKQVSHLLYNNGEGPTDKAALQRIIKRVDDNHEGEDDTAYDSYNRKEIAKLVLQCRELLSTTNYDEKCENGGMDEQQQQQENKQLVLPSSPLASVPSSTRNYSNSALLDTMEYDYNDPVIEDDQNDVQIETESQLFLPIIRAAIKNTLSPMTTYERTVMNLFTNDEQRDTEEEYYNSIHAATEDKNYTNCIIHPCWIEPLLSLTKASSRSLVKQLSTSANCPMGYDPTAGNLSQQQQRRGSTNTTATMSSTTTASPLLSYVRNQKSFYFRDLVLLTRVGDFYEAYGIDAIMLVEHCGLNPMAGKARAGCPWRNIQDTLDKLTNSGFRVAVYEEDDKERKEGNGKWKRMSEGNDEVELVVDNSDANGSVGDSSGNGSKGNKLKTRYLSQVVSSANPTYMHGLVLSDDYSVGGGTASNEDMLSMSSHGELSSPGRNFVGVIALNSGYTLVEICAEERSAVISERLTSEAVCCRLAAFQPADPIFYVPLSMTGTQQRTDRLPFLPWMQKQQTPRSGGMKMGKVQVKTLPSSLVVGPRHGLSDVERAKQTIVSAFLRLEEYDHRSPVLSSVLTSSSPSSRKSTTVTHDDFTVIITPSSSGTTTIITRPLHLETATQLGLMADPAIPSLISSLLPDSAPASTRRYLRRWLLIPPPPEIADAMSTIVRTLIEDDYRPLPPVVLGSQSLSGQVVSLIRAGQASATVYREILVALDAASEVLLLDHGRDDSNIVNALLAILLHDTGIHDMCSTSLRNRIINAMKEIERVVNTQNMEHSLMNIEQRDHNHDIDCVSYYGDVVPSAFFERNEAIWRGRVKLNAMKHCAYSVETTARRLAEAVAIDFWGVEDDDGVKYDNDETIINLTEAKELKSPIVQDIFNNLIAIKSIPPWAKQRVSKEEGSETSNSTLNVKNTEINKSSHPYYFHPRDRNGKILGTRYTTDRVQMAMSDYVEACSNARAEVERVLTGLSWNLIDGGHLTAILQSSHLNLILATAANHAANSKAKGWSAATLYDDADNDGDVVSSAGYFNNVWPYWMSHSASVSNAFDLDGMFLLTAPNMSGKSTLMRSTAAAALLINSGLCGPVKSGTRIRRFDSIFVRGASADVPTEDKSAFGSEMGDVASLLRSCGSRSLVFVDEIGRGTSPKDGTSLAGAILEEMSGSSGMSGMFATHLHGILNLPYSSAAESRLRKKRMAITEDDDGDLKWTYLLEDGICTNR